MFKDKNQAVKHPADILPKKVGETLPPQSSQMGYGIYHFCECEYSRRMIRKMSKTNKNSHENRLKPQKKQKIYNKTKKYTIFGMHTLLLFLSFILVLD